MKIWAVTVKEYGGTEEIVHDGERHLVYADELYAEAFKAFQGVIANWIGLPRATYGYGEFGADAHTHITVRDSEGFSDTYSYEGDVVQLRPYDVIGG